MFPNSIIHWIYKVLTKSVDPAHAVDVAVLKIVNILFMACGRFRQHGTMPYTETHH